MKPSVEEIRSVAAKYADEYEYVGVRTQEEPFSLGEIDHLSHVWIDNDDTGEELDGLCATSVNSDAVRMHSNDPDVFQGEYWGEHVALVCGFLASGGDDLGELIFHDPVVVHIFC